MGFTHYYYWIPKAVNVAKANCFYKNLLSATKTDDNKNLYSIFRTGLDFESWRQSEELNQNFHEMARDEMNNPVVRNLSIKSDFDFLKTAHKRFDLAVMLSYLYLSYLEKDFNHFKSDMSTEMEHKLKHEFFRFADWTCSLQFREVLKEYVDKESIDFNVEQNLDDIMFALVSTVWNRNRELA